MEELYCVDLIRETIRKRKNGMRGYLQAYNEVNELAGELQAAVFEEMTDPDQIMNIDAQFAAELQDIKKAPRYPVWVAA